VIQLFQKYLFYDIELNFHVLFFEKASVSPSSYLLNTEYLEAKMKQIQLLIAIVYRFFLFFFSFFVAITDFESLKHLFLLFSSQKKSRTISKALIINQRGLYSICSLELTDDISCLKFLPVTDSHLVVLSNNLPTSGPQILNIFPCCYSNTYTSWKPR